MRTIAAASIARCDKLANAADCFMPHAFGPRRICGFAMARYRLRKLAQGFLHLRGEVIPHATGNKRPMAAPCIASRFRKLAMGAGIEASEFKLPDDWRVSRIIVRIEGHCLFPLALALVKRGAGDSSKGAI